MDYYYFVCFIYVFKFFFFLDSPPSLSFWELHYKTPAATRGYHLVLRI